MKYVFDASVAVKCVLPEKDSPKAVRLLNDYRKKIHALIAPDIFPVEIAHAKVDHPLESPVAEVRRVFLERLEGRRPCAGPPGPGVGIDGDAADAEIRLVPFGQLLRVFGAEEKPADALYPLHVAGGLAWRVSKTKVTPRPP